MSRLVRDLSVVAILALLAAAAATRAAAQGTGCDGAEHRQFDFWVGDWLVTNPDGSTAGTNTITSILGGCVLHESWEGSTGSVGESFNIYDRQDGRWHQTWVDNSGNRLDLAGGIKDGAMVLEGTTVGNGGGEVLHRITWTPLEDGKVRQHWQMSRDAGGTWADAFLGVYARRGEDGG